MDYKRFLLIAVTTLLTTSLQSAVVLSGILPTQEVLAQSTEARKLEADRLFKQGMQQLEANQLEAALQSFQKALTIYQDIKNRRGEGAVLAGLGLVYSGLQDYPKAIDYYKQSLVIAREIKDSELEAIVQEQLANAQLRRSNPQKVEADRLLDQGIQQYQTDQFKAALQSWEQALQIYREIKDRAGEGGALVGLGNAYLFLGNYNKAIEFYQQSLAIFQQIGDKASKSGALGNLGNVYKSLGDYKKAIEFYQQNLAIAKQIGDRSSEGRALGNLGLVSRSLGDYKKAIEFHQQSLAIFKQIGDKAGEGKELNNLGNTYLFLGDYNKAIEFYQQSLAIFKQIGNKVVEGQILGNLGTSYDYLEDYKKAIEFHQQSLAIFKQIGDRRSEGITLSGLGNIYLSLEDYNKAIEFHQQNLAIFKQIGDKAGEGNALNNLGVAYYKQGKLTLAENTLMEGIKIKESLRNSELKDNQKVTFFDTQRNTYNTLQLVLIAQNKTDAALKISERGRARAFVELIVSRNKQVDKSAAPLTITQIKQIAKAQNATLVQYSIIYDEFKIAGERQVKDSEIYIWVIKPTGEVAFKKVDLKSLRIPLNELVSTTRDSMGVRSKQFSAIVKNPIANPQEQTEKLQQLHQLLIKPIAQLLPTDDNSRVIFIPHQDLFLAPFPALMDAKGKYLIEKYTILTAPSIQVLALTKEQRQKLGNKTGEYLIVGNPSPMPPGFPPLNGAEKEAKAIAQLFNTKPLIGSQATEPIVTKKLSTARVIHLATHGTFNEQQPRESGIALAPGGGSDGMLTAGEIFDSNLKLNAELLVLSACDTGRGRITGDGVIGLSRSLIAAGVPSILISLWQVDDAATAELMTEFYTNVYERKLDKAQGLRQAMLKVKEQYPNYPKAWAAFTLVGEAE